MGSQDERVYRDCYPATKTKKILTYAVTWMNLKDLVLMSQSQKDKYRMTRLACGPWRSQIHGDREQKGGCQGLGERGGDRVSVPEEEDASQTLRRWAAHTAV